MEQYFETERLIIRRFNISDADDLYEYLSDESVVKYEPYCPLSKDECIQAAVDRSENGDFWAVCLKDSGKLIGNIYFSRRQPTHFLTWELGYVFNAKFQGVGYATESCRQILKYAFEELGARRIIAKCNPKNSSSWRLLTRLKFRREGHLIEVATFKNDEEGNPIWHDAYEYAMLHREWMADNRSK